MSDRLAYTVREFAALLGVSEDTVYEGVREGRIPHVRPTPGRIVIPKRAADAWLNGATSDHGAVVVDSAGALRH